MPDQAVVVVIGFFIGVIVPNFSLLILAVLVFRALKKQIAAIANAVVGTANRAIKSGMKTTRVFLAIAGIRCITYISYAWQSLRLLVHRLEW